jgi:hypothetical protein
MWRILIKLVNNPAVQNAALFLVFWVVEEFMKDEPKKT